MEENKLEFIETFDMNFAETEKWEKSNNAVAVQFDNGGRLECLPTWLYSPDKDMKPIPGSEQKALIVSVCDEDAIAEISMIITGNKELRKLRDFLNLYLEGEIQAPPLGE